MSQFKKRKISISAEKIHYFRKILEDFIDLVSCTVRR